MLFFGAGVLGSVYAARLHEAGVDVTVLARGRRLADIREHGIVLEEFGPGSGPRHGEGRRPDAARRALRRVRGADPGDAGRGGAADAGGEPAHPQLRVHAQHRDGLRPARRRPGSGARADRARQPRRRARRPRRALHGVAEHDVRRARRQRVRPPAAHRGRLPSGGLRGGVQRRHGRLEALPHGARHAHDQRHVHGRELQLPLGPRPRGPPHVHPRHARGLRRSSRRTASASSRRRCASSRRCPTSC
jgi:hypothetical protein